VFSRLAFCAFVSTSLFHSSEGRELHKGPLGFGKAQVVNHMLWLHPEDAGPNGGHVFSDRSPQWEISHDQKRGIRIGESRIPAQTDRLPTVGKVWTCLTANITAWSSAGLQWAVHEDDDALLLQETRLSRKQIRGAKGAATGKGYDAVFAPAMPSTCGGQNKGGVGVMVKHPRKVKQIFPEGENPHFEKGRWIHAVTEGNAGAGLHLFSIYGYDTGKVDHDRLNMELDQEVFGAIATLNGAAWMAGGDWNRTPEMISMSGAAEAVGGFIAQGEGREETCIPEKGEHRVLDFFILGPGVREVTTKVEVVLDAKVASLRPCS
jgi:hypothetical protein